MKAQIRMTSGMWKTGLRMILAFVLLLAVLFGSAGRWDLPFLWAYLALMIVVMVAAALLLDPGLVQERARPGPGGTDRGLRFLVMPFFAAHLVVAGLDVGRFQWSGSISPAVQICALIGLAASMGISVWAAGVNRFFSPVVRIQAERGHHVISDGPYRWVRHPGYTAAFGSMICAGPALGSWWSMLPLAPVLVLILRRTIIEDRFLHERLEGYTDYAKHVRHKLVPGVW